MNPRKQRSTGFAMLLVCVFPEIQSFSMQNFQTQNISDEESLRQLYRPPSPGAIKKCIRHLDSHARQFISLSPFVLLATSDAREACDISPRGGPPGHVAILDDRKLLLPDRPGNNRLDSFHNILRFHHVGLLFFIPGVSETLRVNGRASICTCPDLLQRCMGGRPPKAGLVIEVEKAFLHCSMALELARFWQPSTWPQTRALPSAGKIWADHISQFDVK